MYIPSFLSVETLVLLITSLVLVRIYIHKKWQFLKNINIPHIQPTILQLGTVRPFIGNSDWMMNSHEYCKRKLGKIYGAYLFLTPQITVADPDIIKQMYIKEFATFPTRQTSLTKINGKVMNDQGKFEAKSVFGKLALDITCSAAFSVDTHPQELKDGQEPKIIKMVKQAFGFEISRSPLVMLCFMFPAFEEILCKLDYSIIPKDTVNYFANLTKSLIDQRKHSTVKPRVDLMQLMLNDQISVEDVAKGKSKGLTQLEITSNSVLMVLAGYDTSANALTLLAYNLATHKHVQKKVQEEIDKMLEKYGSLTYEALNSMKYLGMCLNETLRLYPPIAVNSRIPNRDITINGVFLPKGIQVIVPVYGMSRDEEIWEEPLKFKPERMEDMRSVDSMIFQPFGGGPRGCIGMRFAVLEIKLAIAKILQDFNLDVCENTPKPPVQLEFKSTTLKPKGDIYLRVTPKSN
uniref:cytochrome P450 3A25-like isoform X2 n=1 Tax=Ciona intestinalis TaxID=7719 RepID=UPI000EF4DAB3|nr:cytochrome P450 3A25-like isoform X2 [Ciona intestinalis]|eukprot:XP_026690466.1 cytochrome P450 3A25-like isoform X2 [Ciona intestinalis]